MEKTKLKFIKSNDLISNEAGAAKKSSNVKYLKE